MCKSTQILANWIKKRRRKNNFEKSNIILHEEQDGHDTLAPAAIGRVKQQQLNLLVSSRIGKEIKL